MKNRSGNFVEYYDEVKNRMFFKHTFTPLYNKNIVLS